MKNSRLLLTLLILTLGLGGCVLSPSQTTPDVNYWSYSGDDSGSLFLTNPANPGGLQLRSGPLPVYVIPGLTIILTDASGYNDVLKFSHAVNILVDGSVTVYTGGNQQEQDIDMNNHCSNISFRGAINLQEGQQNAWTIKGGCHGIHAETVTITPGSGNCDMELGGISTQVPTEKTTDVTIGSLTRTDGKPAQVRVWTPRADNPTITSGNAVIIDLNL
jgi:cold shock CspA family protein